MIQGTAEQMKELRGLAVLRLIDLGARFETALKQVSVKQAFSLIESYLADEHSKIANRLLNTAGEE